MNCWTICPCRLSQRWEPNTTVTCERPSLSRVSPYSQSCYCHHVSMNFMLEYQVTHQKPGQKPSLSSTKTSCKGWRPVGLLWLYSWARESGDVYPSELNTSDGFIPGRFCQQGVENINHRSMLLSLDVQKASDGVNRSFLYQNSSFWVSLDIYWLSLQRGVRPVGWHGWTYQEDCCFGQFLIHS